MKFQVVIVLALVSLVSSQSPIDWTDQIPDNPTKVSERITMFFTPDHYTVVEFPLKHLPYLTAHPGFDKTKPTIIYFHGWLESGALDLSVLAIRGAYMDRGDHNVVTVDWSHYSKNVNYRTYVIPQMKIIGETFAIFLRDFLNSGYNVSQLHLVGHSLGGQMVGKVGRSLQAVSQGKMTVPRIFALDPAGPGFENNWIDGMEPIARTDGDFVHILHTCAGQLGMQFRIGHVDFYPDGGTNHPGCNVDVTSSLIDNVKYACDHARSWHFHQLTVRNPEAFPAIRCNSYDDFLTMNAGGKCWKDDIVYMGYGIDPKSRGKYFFQTNANMFNLSRGFDGTRPLRANITYLAVPMGTTGV